MTAPDSLDCTGKLVTVGVFVALMVDGMDLQMLSLALPSLMKELEISSVMGGALSTYTLLRHDFRRTIATGMTTAGLPSTIVNKVMNQQDGGPSVTKIYDRYSYDKEKRHALDTWGRHLDTLIGTGSLGRVVPFPQCALSRFGTNVNFSAQSTLDC